MTIRFRLAVIYFGAIVVTLGLVGAVGWWQLGAALRSSLGQTLETRAAAVATSFENNGQVGLQEGDASNPAGIFVAVFDANGRLVDGTSGVPRGLEPPAPGVGDTDIGLGSGTFAVHAMSAQGGLRVIAGSSLDGIRGTLDHLQGSLVVVGALASVASLAGGWLLAGRALRPVALLTSEASQIGATDIDKRLPEPARRDELQRLATTLNGMLDRVAEAVRRQRSFVAAASHDLRTPLAALQAELELAEDPRTPESELRAAVSAALADARRLGDLATGLLDLAAADADGRAVVRALVPTDLLLDTVARRIGPQARDRGIRLAVSAPSHPARVDRVRLEQALTNLVSNAIAYGPAGGEVDVVARFDPAGPGAPADTPSVLSIDVLDRGPGIPGELATSLFEPFSRGPGAAGPGTGLGLATAAAAVRAHHGSLGFEPRVGGGTRFWIRLPA
jgi:two-component system, OmpR family, sensor kinase